MMISSLGFFRLQDEMLSMSENSIHISCDKISQQILCRYGIPAEVYIPYPLDGKQIKYVMLEFSEDVFTETRNEIFLKIALSPDEIHIVKKSFDEFLAI